MAYEERDQSGSLFKNQKKTTDKHPDYTGKAIVNGAPMFLSAWIKESGSGTKFMSLSFTNRDKPSEPATDRPALDDEIPF